MTRTYFIPAGKQSTHACAAAQIRAMLKAHKIPARVTSSEFSMGNSVRVKLLNDPLPATVKAVGDFCGQFQYGHFDGMVDMYEYSNRRDDIPQVKFVSVDVEYSDAINAEVRAYIAQRYSEKYIDTFDGSTLCWRILNGSHECDFWNSKKPRIIAQVQS